MSLRFSLATFAALAVASSAFSQVSLKAIEGDDIYEGGSAGNVYSENFDSVQSEWTENSSLPGWYLRRKTAVTFLNANTGGTTGGGFYRFGGSPQNEYALGYIPSSGSGWIGIFALRIFNSGDLPITKLFVDYRGEQYRDSTTQVGSITFDYRVLSGAFDGDLATPGTSVEALKFNSPKNSVSGLHNGNAVSARVSLKAAIDLDTPVAPGSEIVLRWVYDWSSFTGQSQSLAIDDVRIKAVPEPASLAALALGFCALRRRRR